jgi:AbrB family looped-hinge helix DNA binding protein
LPQIKIYGIFLLKWQDNKMKTKICQGGRLVIPAAFRKALGLKPGDEVLLILEEGEIRLISKHQAIARAQTLVRRYVPEDRSLSEELIRERREEASHA